MRKIPVERVAYKTLGNIYRKKAYIEASAPVQLFLSLPIQLAVAELMQISALGRGAPRQRAKFIVAEPAGSAN